MITVFPKTSPESPQTSSLVQELRSDVLPAAIGTSGAQAYVGGLTATFIDIGDQISDRLPYFIGAVVLLSFLLLMLVFHSILIPLTAALMNLLSVGAAYGVTVAVFQWGWAKDVIGLDSTVPIVSFIPMMMFAVLFGLSMDYQVFMLTRIREEYNASGDTRLAVVRGLSRTARVITSAALIMIFVFGAFVANPTPEVKMFGLGLAFAVFVDATDRAHDVGAVDHGDPRRRQLVVPEVARQDPAAPRHRQRAETAPPMPTPARPNPNRRQSAWYSTRC